jgi:hypothetical protein
MGVVDFKTSWFFSRVIFFCGVLLAFVGIVGAITNLFVGLMIFTVCVIIFTTHYRLSVDFDNKVFLDYVWILGIKRGEPKKFEAIEYIFIKSSNVSQTMHSRIASTTIRKEVFDGYLKFSEEDKIHLMTMDDKDELIQKLKPIAEKLNAIVIDHTEGEAREIST